MPNDIVTVEPDDSLKTWGWVSYILHLVVAVGAVLPGAQASIGLLVIALVIDLVKRDDAALLGRIMTLAPKLAVEQGCRPYPEGGFRIVVNTGAEGGQEVHHLHVHVMGGPRPWLRG